MRVVHSYTPCPTRSQSDTTYPRCSIFSSNCACTRKFAISVPCVSIIKLFILLNISLCVCMWFVCVIITHLCVCKMRSIDKLRGAVQFSPDFSLGPAHARRDRMPIPFRFICPCLCPSIGGTASTSIIPSLATCVIDNHNYCTEEHQLHTIRLHRDNFNFNNNYIYRILCH